MLQYTFSFLMLILLMLPGHSGAASQGFYTAPPLPPSGVTGRVIAPTVPAAPAARPVSPAPAPAAQAKHPQAQPPVRTEAEDRAWRGLEERGYAPYHGRLIYEQDMGENLCALTFDDGPSNYTPQLLDTLDAHGVPGTFFMLGVNAAKLPHVVRRVVEEGHEVASHSYKHPDFKRISAARRWEELDRTNKILRSCGADPVLFRPPYGSQDHALAVMAADLGLRIVTWSYDTEDWKHLPADYTQLRDPKGRIAGAGHMRGIFLFHDIHKTTVNDIPRVIAQLKAGGCDRFVTVSDYMSGLFLDPEPPMHMTMHRRTPRKPVQEPATTAQASMYPDACGAQPAGVQGEPALAAWHGFARDEISVLPPQDQITSLTRKLKQVFTPGPKSAPARESSTFHVGRHVFLPDVGSRSYIVRPLRHQTADAAQDMPAQDLPR